MIQVNSTSHSQPISGNQSVAVGAANDGTLSKVKRFIKENYFSLFTFGQGISMVAAGCIIASLGVGSIAFPSGIIIAGAALMAFGIYQYYKDNNK